MNNTASIVPLNGSLAKEDEPYFKLKHDFHEGIDFRVYAHSLVSVERQISKAYNYTGIKIQRNHLAVTHVQKGCIETYIHEMWNQLPGVVQPFVVNYLIELSACWLNQTKQHSSKLDKAVCKGGTLVKLSMCTYSLIF